jgi:2-polyprenyl-3-methyl-5-hydroxy-6-metoxy-1,4-benzoquinol methylase
MSDHLPSIDYSPPDEPSLFDLWATGQHTPLPAPLACRDVSYQGLIIDLIRTHSSLIRVRPTVVSVGAGTGVLEELLAEEGFEVRATDIDSEAIRTCQARGLQTTQFDLLTDTLADQYDVVYCDGVMGHLWQPQRGCLSAWDALADLTLPGGFAIVSNDLADDDQQIQLRVRSNAAARFFRPPAGWYEADANSTQRWTVTSRKLYEYERSGTIRRREILIARLLVNEWVETQDRQDV